MSLIRKIKDYYKKNKSTLFTTPSHAQGEFINECAMDLLGEKFFKCDFSEIDGFDNLREPSGVLKDLQERISQIYHSKKSFILTNGSTSGVVAAMLSVLKENDKVLIARNCHISVCNGLTLSGAKPVWILPEYDEFWGIYKGVGADCVEKALKENPNVKALILTSPTYEGNLSNIKAISTVTKKYGVKLIVDEAHGALLNFGDFKAKPAILSGADISVQSLHKTAGAPNPCALLHIGTTSEITAELVQNALNLINTTSPSYPLILAAECAVEYLNSAKGKKHVKNLLYEIEIFKEKFKSGSIYDGLNDRTKILVKFKNGNNLEAARLLNEKFKIEEEFSTEKSMLFITGIGTTKEKLYRLADVLNKIELSAYTHTKSDIYALPKQINSPRAALQKDHEVVLKKDALGRISAETFAAYPPGIPVIVAGEMIDEEVIKLIEKDKIKVCV